MILRRLLSVLVLLAISASLAAAEALPVLVVDISQTSPTQHLLAVSLQGLANRHPDGPRVFLLTNPRDEEWLTYCLRLSPRPLQTVTVEELLEVIKSELKGQILYDPEQPYTVNIATTAAGLQQAAISPTDLGLPSLLDLRGRWTSASEAYAWAQSALLPGCNQSRAALLPPEAMALRDLAIQERMFTFEAPASPDDPGFQDLLLHLAPGTAIYGEAPAAIAPAISRSSHFLVSAAQAANLSFFSHLETGRAFYQYLAYPDPTANRYLALIFDCSDLGVAVNVMPSLWDRTTRGSLPLGWALPAAIAEAAPPVLHRYYADAYRSGVDGFLLGPSGAGETDLTLAGAPFSFYQATARAVSRLDAHTLLYSPPASGGDPAAAITRLAGETGVRGVFVLAPPDFPPVLYGGIPVLAAPRVDTIAAAISYLDNISLERRFAALCLDPRWMTVADAAHIAAHVARRYVVVPPEQLLDLMRLPAEPSEAGPAAAAITSLQYPESIDPARPTLIKAAIEAPRGLLAASVLYRPAASPLSFYQPLSPADDGYRAELPPLLCGAEVGLTIEAIDPAGRVAWSPLSTINVPRADSDGDGLSDAEESFLLTDPRAGDSDGDGLLDGADFTPLISDPVAVDYFGPIHPPDDSPYLPEPGGSSADAAGRHLQPGQTCLYWFPTDQVPPGGPAVVGLDAAGPATVAISEDGGRFAEQFNGELGQSWHSAALAASLPQGVFLRITCPSGASGELIIRGLGIFSPPGAPSVAGLAWTPAHPGPEQPITISATIFSPNRIAQASLTYRVNGRGEITIPMQLVEGSPRYQASLPALDNHDELEWWIRARDSEGTEAATVIVSLPIGSRARETVSLLGSREFVGDWLTSSDWQGAGRVAPEAGLQESAAANLTGGLYSIWILGGGRGQSIGLYVGDSKVGSLDADRPDGWQQVGRIRLEGGRHQVHLVSEAGPRAPTGAMARYAEVVLTADPSFRPSGNHMLDIYNSLTLLSPRASDTLSGRAELRATGAGNLTGAEFSLDGQRLRSVTGPPFVLPLGTQRLANGPHLLKVEGMDRAGNTGLALEIPVVIAN